MKITKSVKKGVPVLAIKGEVTIDTSPKLLCAFNELYDEGVRKSVVDFKEVSYIDSSGLATMIEILQRFRQNNGSIALSNMSDEVMRIFELAKIDMLLSIYKGQEDAIASLF